MHFGTPFRAKDIKLLLRLDAFSRGLHSHALGNTDHSTHDVERAGVLGEVLDEAPVDLDPVEGEILQIAERRVTRTEVIQGNADAEIAQPIQDAERGIGILQEARLGNLELQPVWRQSRRTQSAKNGRHQSGTSELDGR